MLILKLFTYLPPLRFIDFSVLQIFSAEFNLQTNTIEKQQQTKHIVVCHVLGF